MLLFFSKELKVARGTNLLHLRDRHTVILVPQLFFSLFLFLTVHVYLTVTVLHGTNDSERASN